MRQAKLLQQKLQDTAVIKPAIVKMRKKPAEIFEALNHLGVTTGEKNFLIKLKAFLTMVLQEKLNSTAAIEQELIVVLKAAEPELAAACANIYTSCDRNLYSPLADENIHEEIYFELTAVVKKLYESLPLSD